jgi:hypothetical protein
VYELQYVENGEQHLLKAVIVDGELVFTVMVIIEFIVLLLYMNFT